MLMVIKHTELVVDIHTSHLGLACLPVRKMTFHQLLKLNFNCQISPGGTWSVTALILWVHFVWVTVPFPVNPGMNQPIHLAHPHIHQHFLPQRAQWPPDWSFCFHCGLPNPIRPFSSQLVAVQKTKFFLKPN